MEFKTGDRVFYIEKGPGDIGTVQDVIADDKGYNYVVKWDSDGETDQYCANQLRHLISPADTQRRFEYERMRDEKAMNRILKNP